MWKMAGLCLVVAVGLSALGAEPDVYISVSSNGFAELVLDLKRTVDGQVLDTREILSRYKTPEYEMRDVTGDGVDEVLVYTRDGGTGCFSEHLWIFAVNGKKLIEAAMFEIEGAYRSNPGCSQLIMPDGRREDLPLKEGKVRGAVEFLPFGEIKYSCAEAVRDCEELTLDFNVERYRFNPATAVFELQSR
jgi:hypothetical protein